MAMASGSSSSNATLRNPGGSPMRHEDAALALWLATDPMSPERRAPCDEAAVEPTAAGASARQRAGAAVIALGEWLAGEPRSRRPAVAHRRPVVGRA